MKDKAGDRAGALAGDLSLKWEQPSVDNSELDQAGMPSRDEPGLGRAAWIAGGLILLLCLGLVRFYSFMLFHVLAEGFSIVVAVATFLIVWHARRTMASGFLTLLGTAYLCVAGLDMVHTITYRGMGVIENATQNQSVQTWLIARWIEAGSLLISFRYLGRSLSMPRVLAGYLGLMAASILLVFLGWFPDCYTEAGLTLFKILGEGAVVALLLGALVVNWRCRDRFAGGLQVYMYAAILLTIGAEVFFSLYQDIYGFFPTLGHLCKVASFWMIYRLLVESTLRRPYALLYGNLEKSRQELKRTAGDLSRERGFLRTLVDHVPIGVVALSGRAGKIRLANEAFFTSCCLKSPDVIDSNFADLLGPEGRKAFEKASAQAIDTGKMVHLEEVADFCPDHPHRTWWSLYVVPISGEEEDSLLVLLQDRTASIQQRRELEELSRTLERRVEERTAEAETRTAQLREMAMELTRAEQRERRNLAGVLHDHLQQLLVGAKFRLEAMAGKSEASSESIQQVEKLLDDSLDVTRSATYELYPPMLHEEGLPAGLEWLINWMGDKYELNVELKVDPKAELRSQVLEMFLFQAARELLFNVVKHGQTSQASIWLGPGDEESLEMIVSDEGKGFSPGILEKDSNGENSGFGLSSIRERVEFLGGRFEMDSAPGSGTRIALRVPLDCETLHQRELGVVKEMEAIGRYRSEGGENSDSEPAGGE